MRETWKRLERLERDLKDFWETFRRFWETWERLYNDLIRLEMAWKGFEKTWEDFKRHKKLIFILKVKVWLRREKKKWSLMTRFAS